MALDIKENESLVNHSTFRIGGSAKYFVIAKSKEEILEAIEFAKQKGLPFFILGGGSNMLFHDEGLNGVIIKLQNSEFEIKDSSIIAKGGLFFSKLINVSKENGLTGLEWGIGIPGTVGGGTACNCGAYGHSLSESVKSVTVLESSSSGEELSGWQIKKYSNEECEFSYRKSRFKGSQNDKIILEIEFELKKDDKEKVQERIKDILTSRTGKHPHHPSAGSIFKNIIIDELGENKENVLKILPSEKIKGGKFATAYLIEQCGLKEEQIGQAQISDMHANYIVNLGGAKADDVLELIRICKQKVKEKFNIELEEEIVII